MQAQSSAAYSNYQWPEITEDTKADYEGAIRDWVSYAERQRGLADAWQARALELQKRLALFEGPPAPTAPNSTLPTLPLVAPITLAPAPESVTVAPVAHVAPTLSTSAALAPVATPAATTSATPIPFLGGGAHLPHTQAPAVRAAVGGGISASVQKKPDRQEQLRSFYRENNIRFVNGEYILHHPNGTSTNMGHALPLPFKDLWIKHQSYR